jgi:hypothetical protein
VSYRNRHRRVTGLRDLGLGEIADGAVSRGREWAMTRIRMTLVSVLVTGLVTIGVGSTAWAAGYSSVSALVGPAEPATTDDYSSISAIMGDRESSQSGPGSPTDADRSSTYGSSLNAVLGADGQPSPSTTLVSAPSAGSSDSFDWGDAAIGAGITLGLALTTALMLGVTRRRTRVEPV